MLINVVPIDAESPHLATVKVLWRANSDILGFFPDGAFTDYANRRHILVALAEGQCIGYLLYRVTHQTWRGRISIVHLCVDQNRRGLGIAKALVDALNAATQDCEGIGLSCRRDYDVSQIWPRLGFTATHERPGRSQGASELTFWWIPRNHPDLWTSSNEDVPETRIVAVIDANVFYDLQDQTKGYSQPIKNEESKALLADWLQDSLELCITSEMKNEINRIIEASKRSATRLLADEYRQVPVDKSKEDVVAKQLRKYFPSKLKPSDESDLRQVARTIAADVLFFVTRDGPLLGRADNIYEDFRVRILRPSDLIIRLDELRRESEYQPVSLAATPLTVRLTGSDDQSALATTFQQPDQQETRDIFQTRLRGFLSSPNRFVSRWISEERDKPLSLVVHDTQNVHELTIPLLRMARTKIAPTLARFQVRLCLSQCVSEKRIFIRITDPHLNSEVKVALREDGFIAAGEEWIKVVLPFAGTANDLAHRLEELASESNDYVSFCQGIRERIIEPGATKNFQAMAEVERLLWPAKILDADLPSFIVPIQAKWAQHLFDTDLAKQTLFGANPALALSREAVYYRSALQKILVAPGRVLWYVSQSPTYEGTMSLRACSQIVEVVTGKPKDLFRSFQRLGVYEWSHIFQLAKENLDNDLMVIRFRNTELFPAPIPHRELSELLRDQGQRTQFQSPLRVSKDTFSISMLYKRATREGTVR